jgi:hypothetical protein
MPADAACRLASSLIRQIDDGGRHIVYSTAWLDTEPAEPSKWTIAAKNVTRKGFLMAAEVWQTAVKYVGDLAIVTTTTDAIPHLIATARGAYRYRPDQTQPVGIEADRNVQACSSADQTDNGPIFAHASTG